MFFLGGENHTHHGDSLFVPQEVLKEGDSESPPNVSRKVAGDMHVFTGTSLTDVIKDFSEVNPTRVALGCLLMVSSFVSNSSLR